MSEELKLNDRQELFVKEYLVDLNATQAAIRAGYSEKSAAIIGHENLRKPNISRAITKAFTERAQKVDVSAEYVLSTIISTIERCKQSEPVLDRKGEQVVIDTPTGLALAYQFEANAVLKGAELLGKHLKLFTDKTEVKHEGGVDVNIAPKLSKEEWLKAHGLEAKK